MQIDLMLEQSGWVVQDFDHVNLGAGQGIAIREFQTGTGPADYLLVVNRQAVGVIEAKSAGTTLTGVEEQTQRYSASNLAHIERWCNPLPFKYESTGVVTQFTNDLDPKPRSREVFSFHRPETLAGWMTEYDEYGKNLRGGFQDMPPIDDKKLYPVQFEAITKLEDSLKNNFPRALLQMATGSGKTFTAAAAVYRMVLHARAHRVLFLVDRGNLRKQAFDEFTLYKVPGDGRRFDELYNVTELKSSVFDPVTKVCIATIQRVYSMLLGTVAPADLDEHSGFEDPGSAFETPVEIRYNRDLPPETFDIIIVDECHRSIYNKWRSVLDYFDAFIIGLTATPSMDTIGFFNSNLVMQYNHERAVADGINVTYNVYNLTTRVTQQGAKVKSGYFIGKREKATRRVRWEQLRDELVYDPNELDRSVVTPDQMRTLVREFRAKVCTEIFPGRNDVPKTLVYAKSDSHADDIVKIIREEFAESGEFCKKITYRTQENTDNLLNAFRTGYYPRIVVTVDMIATGTDIRPLEIVWFMRSVQSRTYFEQMKGRGVRVIEPGDFSRATPDAGNKTHFVIVDSVGVCERDMKYSSPMDRETPSVTLKQLFQRLALGNRSEELLSTILARLSMLERRLSDEQRKQVTQVAGAPLRKIVSGFADAFDVFKITEEAQKETGIPEPDDAALDAAAAALREKAAVPLAYNPELRELLLQLKSDTEQYIDAVTLDEVTVSGFDAQSRERAERDIQSFREYIEQHKDEITALEILYNQPRGMRLRFRDVKALAENIQLPPRLWTAERLWDAYRQLEGGRVRGSGRRAVADLVALVRHALRPDSDLVPYAEQVHARFDAWMAVQEQMGARFTGEQRLWLEMMRDHIADSVAIEQDDFELTPFQEQGGLGRAYALFGESLDEIIEKLNRELAA